MAGNLLLDIKTSFTPGPSIAIDGKVYQMRSPDSLGLRDRILIRSAGQAFVDLGEIGKGAGRMEVNKAGEAETLLAEAIQRIFIDGPGPEVVAKLSFNQCMAVLGAFFGKPEWEKPEGQEIPAAAAESPTPGS